MAGLHRVAHGVAITGSDARNDVEITCTRGDGAVGERSGPIHELTHPARIDTSTERCRPLRPASADHRGCPIASSGEVDWVWSLD